MSTSAIVFSKDRPAQLDLFLRSVTCNAGSVLGDVAVFWSASDGEYERGYEVCQEEHDWVDWMREEDFRDQTLDLLDGSGDYVSFFTDDSVFYRSLDERTTPESVLWRFSDVLCFSLRLGLHTGQCYPMRRLQGLPTFKQVDDFLVWNWRTGDADFGYMGSLDGHVFRHGDILDLLDGTQEFKNPNQLEEVLAREVGGSLLSLAACHLQSHLVGVPVNRVNETHPNRYGELYEHDPKSLNTAYLDGKRILLSSIRADRITAAHAEMELFVE